MRRTTVIDPPPPSPENSTIGDGPSTPVSSQTTLSGQTLPSSSDRFSRLKALGLVALIGILGVGVVWFVRGLNNLEGNDTLDPISTGPRSDEPSPLRDRVQVIRPKEPTSPPADSDAPVLEKQPRSERQEPETDIQLSYGLGASTPGEQADSEEASDLEAEEMEQEEEAEAAEETEETEAAETSGAEVKPATRPNQAQSEEPDFDAVQKVITALLQPPAPIEPIAVATAPRPTPTKPAPISRPIPRPIPRVTLPPQQPDSQPETDPAPATPPTPTAPNPPVVTAKPPENPTPASPPPTSSQPPPTPIAAPTPQPSQTPPTSPTPIAAPTPQPSPTPIVPPPQVAVEPTPIIDSIYINQLPILGSTQFSQRQLAETVRQVLAANPATPAATDDPTVLNRKVTPAELIQASEAVTKLYTDRGYINSGAYVPAEVLNGAAPEIRIIEGKLEKINVQVEPADSLWLAQPLSPGYVEQRLAATIRAPLQIDQLVDAVRLLEQNSLISRVATELAPGTTTGGSVLNVKVKQAPPLRVNFTVNNSRTPSIGALEQQAGLSHANLLGLGDLLQFNFRRTEGSSEWYVGYSIPVTPQNGTLTLGYTNSSGRVIEQPFRELDISSKSQNYEISFRQPLVQTSREEFALTLRGTHYRNRGIFLAGFNDGVALPFPAIGADSNGETRVTAIRFGQEWSRRSEQDAISIQSEFSYGLGLLGASILPLAPDSRFLSWQGRGFWVRSLGPDTLLALRGRIQLADRQLVPVEQISLGGADTVRGYRPSTLLSDNGLFASVEGYVPVLRVPEWNGLLQAVPFFDVAQGWNNAPEQPNPNMLMSVGVGLQWKMGDNFRARLDWGVPLINSSVGAGRSLEQNLFFSITYSP